MTGTKNGISAQFNKLNENCKLSADACYCHSPNLAVGDSINNIPLLKDTLDMAFETTKLLKKSLK